MPVFNPVNGKGEKISYVGCVMDTYEHNGYHDSDWYATCWDEEKQKVVDVLYDTTRCGGYGSAKIDITPDNLRKVYRYYFNDVRKHYDEHYNKAQAMNLRIGDAVRVVSGRKFRRGSEGKVFWLGSVYNEYSRQNEERVGIEVNGERRFLGAHQVEVVGWEDRLVRGKKRKSQIRHLALARIPAWCRKELMDE